MPTAELPWSQASLNSWLGEITTRVGIPGAALAIRRGDLVLHAEAGVQNVRTGEPVSPDSVFQIGSTTKVMTAALVLQLADEGALELDGAIGDWLGQFTVGAFDASNVTVRELLNHTSGLPGNYFADFGPGDESIRRYVESLSTQRMIHQPGAMFSYCNGGYVVAGRLAELVTGMSFADLIRDRIAAPLALRSTTSRLEDVRPERVAAGHEMTAPGVHGLAALQTAAWSSAPAGSIVLSTATELAQIGYALSSARRSELMSPGGRELLTSPSVELPCPYWGRVAQCLGWGYDVRGDQPVLLHGGGTTGHSAMLLALPNLDISIALLTNSAQGGLLLAPAERRLMEALGVPFPQSAPEVYDEISEGDLDRLVGTYTDIWTTSRVQREKHELVLKRHIHASSVSPGIDLPPVPLKAMGPRLFSLGAGRPLLFIGSDPDDDQSPPDYIHQLNASVRISPG